MPFGGRLDYVLEFFLCPPKVCDKRISWCADGEGDVVREHISQSVTCAPTPSRTYKNTFPEACAAGPPRERFAHHDAAGAGRQRVGHLRDPTLPTHICDKPRRNRCSCNGTSNRFMAASAWSARGASCRHSRLSIVRSGCGSPPQ